MAEMGSQAKKVVRKRRTTNSQHSFPRFEKQDIDE